MTARFTPMSCEEFAANVADFLERDLDEAARAAVEAHALDCDACGALLSDLRRLSVDAANLPELSPSRDLWDGIAARIDAPVIPIGTRSETRGGGRFGGRVGRDRSVLRAAALAASLLVAAGLGAAVMFQLMRDRDTRPVATSRQTTPNVPILAPGSTQVVMPDSSAMPSVQRAVAATPTESGTDSSLAGSNGPSVTTVSNPKNRSAEQTFDAEITRLRAIVQRRRSQFDPVTISVIERNLKVIDDAIAQCRGALAKDPASRFLIESLNHALENKVELLRTAAMLPART
jgi:putative zinc finger protein